MAILKEYTFICEHCGETFTKMIDVADYEKDKNRKKKKYNYRFCSRSCANSRIMTKEKKEKIRKSVKLHYDQCDKLVNMYEYTCEKCGKLFIHTSFRKGRRIHCDECKQLRKHVLDNPTLMDLSTRTISKLLVRANKGCSICGWNESTCDIHHIISRSNGGTNDISNLVVVCPNCHRVIHTTDKYSIDYLLSLSILKTFSNWKDFYHPSN